MFKLQYNCTHLTCQQGNAQYPSSQASTVCELRNSRHTSWIQKRQRNQTSNFANICWVIEKARELHKNIYCFIEYAKAFDCTDHNKLQKILKEMGIQDHLTCLLRNLYAGKKATVRTRHGTMDWFKIGKRVCQGYILSPCLFNLHASISLEMSGRMRHKLESRLPG